MVRCGWLASTPGTLVYVGDKGEIRADEDDQRRLVSFPKNTDISERSRVPEYLREIIPATRGNPSNSKCMWWAGWLVLIT